MKENIPVKRNTILYIQKMNNRVYKYLQERNLIHNENEDAILVEQNVALYYMSLLAQFVAKTNKEYLVIPSTDVKDYERIAFHIAQKKEHALNILLERALPVPDTSVPIEEVLEFKNGRKEELDEFHEYLGTLQSQIKRSEDADEVQEVLLKSKRKIQNEITKIERTLKEAKIKTFFKGLDTLLKLDNPKLYESLASPGLAGGVTMNPMIALAVGAISVTGNLACSYFTERKTAKNSQLSYLFEAKKQGIIG